MDFKKLVPFIRLQGEGVKPIDIVNMDNLGADAVLLSAEGLNGGEETLIKTIKAVCDQSDIPMYVKRKYVRLEDVKKIIYAGAERVVMDILSTADYKLMAEASARFGEEKIAAWIPENMTIDKELIEKIRHNGASLCITTASAVEIFTVTGMPHMVIEENTSNIGELLKNTCITGIISEDYFNKQMNFMDMKAILSEQGIEMNRFQSSMPFSEFKLNSNGLIPVIVQEYKTNEVLMLAYMNEESFNETIRSGRMTYWSRSRQELWKKGETSGHYQYVRSLDIDCDQDTILAKVVQIGAACHTGNKSCFYRNLAAKDYNQANPMTIFEDVIQTIVDRRDHPKEGSYTNYLFDQGIDKILKKVGEEATEIVIAAKNPDSDELKYEICDFLYHMMVLMVERNVTWKEITKELAERH